MTSMAINTNTLIAYRAHRHDRDPRSPLGHPPLHSNWTCIHPLSTPIYQYPPSSQISGTNREDYRELFEGKAVVVITSINNISSTPLSEAAIVIFE
jgi:hypothetical protein